MAPKNIDKEPMLEETSEEVLLEETSGTDAMLEESTDNEVLLEETAEPETVMLEETQEESVLLEETSLAPQKSKPQPSADTTATAMLKPNTTPNKNSINYIYFDRIEDNGKIFNIYRKPYSFYLQEAKSQINLLYYKEIDDDEQKLYLVFQSDITKRLSDGGYLGNCIKLKQISTEYGDVSLERSFASYPFEVMAEKSTYILTPDNFLLLCQSTNINAEVEVHYGNKTNGDVVWEDCEIDTLLTDFQHYLQNFYYEVIDPQQSEPQPSEQFSATVIPKPKASPNDDSVDVTLFNRIEDNKKTLDIYRKSYSFYLQEAKSQINLLYYKEIDNEQEMCLVIQSDITKRLSDGGYLGNYIKLKKISTEYGDVLLKKKTIFYPSQVMARYNSYVLTSDNFRLLCQSSDINVEVEVYYGNKSNGDVVWRDCEIDTLLTDFQHYLQNFYYEVINPASLSKIEVAEEAPKRKAEEEPKHKATEEPKHQPSADTTAKSPSRKIAKEQVKTRKSEEETRKKREEETLLEMTCPFCGAVVEKKFSFCPECGAPMSGTLKQRPKTYRYSKQQHTNSGSSTLSSSDNIFIQQKNKNSTWSYIAKGILGIFLLIIVGDFLLPSKSNDDMEDEQAIDQPISQNITLYGAVDKYPITMSLTIEGSVVEGTYYYNKQGPDKVLTLSGVINNGEIDIYESDEHGRHTGHFKGFYDGGVFQGEFTTPQGKSMSFKVSQ